MMARAVEVVGERWTLLIVRDLLFGTKRFSDLERSLNDITPARLTDRLRLLESAGILTRTPSEAGREVWYGLTDAGLAAVPWCGSWRDRHRARHTGSMGHLPDIAARGSSTAKRRDRPSRLPDRAQAFCQGILGGACPFP